MPTLREYEGIPAGEEDMKPEPLKTELALYRYVMRQIAGNRIRTRDQRIASSLIEFVESMRIEKHKRKIK